MATLNSGQTATETFGTTSPVTGAAPTAVDGTDGQPVQDFCAITVVAQVASGQTLSGAGTLQCYVFDPVVALWARRVEADLAVNVTIATTRQQCWNVEIKAPRGQYYKWVPNAVTFAGGGSAGVTVYQLGYTPQSAGKYRGV
jgi:hypothetical protein